jgi:hypothetical protein
VLGPLLFNIYINDFPLEISKLAEVILFADDTSIICTSKDYNNLEIKLKEVLTHMIKWFQANSLTLNFDKTKILKFTHTLTTNYQLNISFLDTILKTAESVTFLGLQMDNHLMHKTHINHLLHKMSTLSFLMRKLLKLLSINNLKSVYYAYFHSLVKYAITY